jgi:hypothetical protein
MGNPLDFQGQQLNKRASRQGFLARGLYQYRPKGALSEVANLAANTR